MKRRHADPEFARAHSERASESLKRLHADPEFARANSERMKRLHAEKSEDAVSGYRGLHAVLMARLRRPPTQAELAREAGVSRAAVCRMAPKIDLPFTDGRWQRRAILLAAE